MSEVSENEQSKSCLRRNPPLGSPCLAWPTVTCAAKRRRTRERAGGSNPEMCILREPTHLTLCGRPRRATAWVVSSRSLRGPRLRHAANCLMHGSREISAEPRPPGRQSREGNRSYAVMINAEKSDEAIVPRKSPIPWVTPGEGDGGKGRGQGESHTLKHSPDSEPGCCAPKRVWVGVTAAPRSDRSHSASPRWEPGAGNPLAGFCPGGGP